MNVICSYRGSDTGSGMDSEAGETCAEMLLSSRNQDDEEQSDEKQLSQSLPDTPKTPSEVGKKVRITEVGGSIRD